MKKLKPTSKKKLPYFELNKDSLRGDRIGQFCWNAMAYAGKWKAPEANVLFFIEDKEFVKILNNYIKKYYGKN